MAVGAALAFVAVTSTASSSGSRGDQAGPVPAPSEAAPSEAAATSEARLPGVSVSASSMTASTPIRLQIPRIGVDSDLASLGLADDGTMEVPAEGFPAGWYTGAPTPGELGPAVIVGHVDWGGAPGVFADLPDLEQGDEVTVLRADGTKAVFRVTLVEQFPKDRFPTDAVYGDLDHPGLRLITCGGSFDRQASHYVDNIVVFAVLL